MVKRGGDSAAKAKQGKGGFVVSESMQAGSRKGLTVAHSREGRDDEVERVMEWHALCQVHQAAVQDEAATAVTQQQHGVRLIGTTTDLGADVQAKRDGSNGEQL